MKAPLAKTSTNSNAHSVNSSSEPFFSNNREDSFSSQESREPFFSPIQTKLTTGQPGDRYEQEANAMTDKVVSQIESPNMSSIQTKCEACEKEELQKKEEEEEEMEGMRKPIFESGGESLEDIQTKTNNNSNAKSTDRKELLAHELQQGRVNKQIQKNGNRNCQNNGPSWKESGNLIGFPYPPVRSKICPPNINIVEDITVYQDLLQKAETFLAHQEQRADNLLDHDGNVKDYRYWFARVYQYVTENEIAFVKARNFYYPSYVLRSVLYFEKIYRDNFDAFENEDSVEEHWRTAFETGVNQQQTTELLEQMMPALVASSADPKTIAVIFTTYLLQKVLGATNTLVSAMKAHIRFDLPRAEAWVFNTYYKNYERASLGNFRADFMSMAGVFDNAAAKMNIDMAKRLGLPVDLAPQLLQDTAMRVFFDADMGTERADTWRRAELLVSLGLSTSDPYSFATDGSMQGDVTHSNNLSGLNNFPQNDLIPSMEDSAEMDDERARALANGSTLNSLSATTKVRILRALFKGGTFNEDENAIIRVLNQSVSDPAFVEIVDGADAWDLMYALDFSQNNRLRNLLRTHYYKATSQKTAIRLINKCLSGETAEWEEEMVVDILKTRLDRNQLIAQIGVYEILYNLTGAEFEIMKSHIEAYYKDINKLEALELILRGIDGETAEWEEEMIINILLAMRRHEAEWVIRRIGVIKEGNMNDSLDNFKNGLNVLEWQLDGVEEDLLDDNFGDY